MTLENLINKIKDKTLTLWELEEFHKNWEQKDISSAKIVKIINALKENGCHKDFVYGISEAFFRKWEK